MEVQGYRLGFRPQNATLDTTVELSARERTYTLTDIRPAVTYIFTLAAKSRAGYGEEARQEVEVPDQPPSGFPQVSDEVNATCCSLQLSWSPPDSAQENSVIPAYNINYRELLGTTRPAATPAPALPLSAPLCRPPPSTPCPPSPRFHTLPPPCISPPPTMSLPDPCPTLSRRTPRD